MQWDLLLNGAVLASFARRAECIQVGSAREDRAQLDVNVTWFLPRRTIQVTAFQATIEVRNL